MAGAQSSCQPAACRTSKHCARAGKCHPAAPQNLRLAQFESVLVFVHIRRAEACKRTLARSNKMLRHLKQRRDQAEVAGALQHEASQSGSTSQVESQQQQQQQHNSSIQARRVRGRRSSKPAMEKRRRARMNQSLDELKFYVLNDQNNLRRLGIDASSIENMDEETVARTMLKSSGLIHRHRGRKNPNKLEKADILELTVDYVRMLLKQTAGHRVAPSVPLTLSLPLTDQARLSLQAIPPSPPNSLGSSGSPTPQPLLAISANQQQHQLAMAPIDTCCDALDLRSVNKLPNLAPVSYYLASQELCPKAGQQQQQHFTGLL